MTDTTVGDFDTRPTQSTRGRLSIYVHLPFCRVKCTYCAFAISTDLRLEQRYISALGDEMRRRVPTDVPLGSIYLGGGTPSRLSSGSVERLGRELSRWWVAEGAEVTMEVNPEDVSREAVSRWTEHFGVNRLSLGVQSFHDDELRPLGRQHGSSGARDAIECAAALVPRLSLDLILGLPHQTVASVASSTEAALATPAGHLSLYLLDLEPESALERRVTSGRVDLPPDERTAEMYRVVVQRAEVGGLSQYEVSNFARSGEESIHNRRYWNRESYIGVGLSAHSFDGASRSSNVRSIIEYVETIEAGEDPTVFRETLGEEEIRHERLFLGMRQASGLSLGEFHSLTDDSSGAWLSQAIEQGWVTIDQNRVRFTVEGFLLSDELLAQLF